MYDNSNMEKNIAILLKTRKNKIDTAWENLDVKHLQLTRAEEKVKEAKAALAVLEEERDLCIVRHHNAVPVLEVAQTWSNGPQSINWFSNKFGISYLELKQYLTSPDLVFDLPPRFLEQVQFCIDHPGDKEYKDYK